MDARVLRNGIKKLSLQRYNIVRKKLKVIRMKIFKQVKSYIYGKGLIETDIVFNEKIVGFQAFEAEEISLPKDAIVVPGFIDQHVHGAGGAEAGDCTLSALEQIAVTLAKGGTSAFLATTVTQKEEDILSACACVAEYMETKNEKGAEVLGLHLEGPFLSTKYKGAMKEEYILPTKAETFDKMYEASHGNIKMITLAPEKDGSEEFIAYVKKKGVTVSLGHTSATHVDIINAMESGAQCITHTYNAQSPLHHREIGTLGSALLLDELYCELIADTVHVSIPAMKLLVKNKPKDKLILITDALRAQGLPEGLSDTGGLPVMITKDCVRLLDGTLAGTVIPMNGMVRNMVEKIGVSFETAIDYATINPARNLGIDNGKGSIAVGKDADFTVLSKDFEVYMTVRGGEIIYDNRSK